MNRKALVVSLGTVIVALVIGYFFMNRKNIIEPTAGNNIIIFGDSLVSGIGATPGNDVATLLQEKLGIPILNAGRAGDTTESALERLDAEVLAKDARIVVVILGGNDYLRRVPKAETYQNIRTIVSKIKETGAAVILVGISRLVYNSEYRKIAQELNVQFVPHLLDETATKPELMADSIHPNNDGYKVFADKIEPYIKNVLK